MINYSLTIVIVTFNSSEIIKQSLENIDCNKYLLIIVDNASTDNTVAVIESNFPSLKIIKNNKNIGYGRANNIALRQVETEFAMILNPDAFIFEKESFKYKRASSSLLASFNVIPTSKSDIKRSVSLFDNLPANLKSFKASSNWLSFKLACP